MNIFSKTKAGKFEIAGVNVDGLTPDEVRLLEGVADIFRTARNRERARAAFRSIWESWKKGAVPVDEREVERAVAEAIAEVRANP